MFLLFLLSSSFSIFIGIDVGAAYTKASIVNGSDSIEIGLNNNNNPITPTFIGFRAKPRFNLKLSKFITSDEVQYLTPIIGEKALDIIEVRPNMGAGHFPDLIELNDTYKPERAQLLLTSLNASRVEFHDLAAIFYKKYIDSIANDQKVEQIAMVVPAKYLFLQRYQLEMILRYSGYNKIYFTDDTDAVAYVYANDKPTKFSRKERSILFIDIGATSVKAYVQKFSNRLSASGHSSFPQVQRYSYNIDYETGGLFLTLNISEYLQKKYGFISKTEGEKRRLFNAAERLKKMLSEEEKALVIVSEINGIDRTLEMSRNELYPLLTPFIDSIIKVAKDASVNLQYDEVEVIGGGSKISKIIDSLKIGLNVAAIGQSLDPEHTLTKGAGYFLQFVNDISRFQNVEITEPSSIYNISMMTMNGNQQLCDLGKICVNSVSINGNSTVVLFEYGQNEARPGLAAYSYGFFLDIVDTNIDIKFKHLPFQLYDIRHCNKSGCHRMSLQLLQNPEGPTSIFPMFFDTNAQKERTEEVKKSIREISEKVLEDVSKNNTFRFFSNYSQRLEIIRTAEATKEWLKKNEFKDDVNPSNFTEILENLEKVVNPVYNRISENTTLLKAVNMFYGSLTMAKNGSEIEWPKTKPFMDQRTLKRYNEIVKEHEDWFNQAINLSRKTPPYLDRPFKPSEFEDRAMKLFDMYRIADAIERKKKRTGKKLQSKPTPQPTSEKDDTDSDVLDIDDDEKHNPEYEYVDMDDNEMAAFYSENEWVDPFIERENKKPTTKKGEIEKFKLSKEMKHYINKRSKQFDEEERRKNETLKKKAEKELKDQSGNDPQKNEAPASNEESNEL